MVHLERVLPMAVKESVTDREIDIVADALLHEMERLNKALDLVTDEDARHAIQKAKDKVYRVHQKVCLLLVDEEQHEGYHMD